MLTENLVELLKARGLTCATAESCTGGGVGSAITSVPGSSAVYKGGVVSYANEVKHKVLGVSSEDLSRVGAVSSEVAAQMATGVRALLDVDLAVSVTGIAGPDGGSAEKPVGLVWFGLATREGVRTEKALFRGEPPSPEGFGASKPSSSGDFAASSRAKIREQAVTHALGMLMIAASPQ